MNIPAGNTPGNQDSSHQDTINPGFWETGLYLNPRSLLFVIGRKNWLFCKSNDGAVAAADAYSLVETAKANGLDVLKYLNYVFQKIPIADGNLTDDFLESLMPWNEAVRAQCQRGYI